MYAWAFSGLFYPPPAGRSALRPLDLPFTAGLEHETRPCICTGRVLCLWRPLLLLGLYFALTGISKANLETRTCGGISMGYLPSKQARQNLSLWMPMARATPFRLK